jgi:hypothetical protein
MIEILLTNSLLGYNEEDYIKYSNRVIPVDHDVIYSEYRCIINSTPLGTNEGVILKRKEDE